jgi:hypothetical protein
VYDLTSQIALEDLIGKLYVEWGEGFRAWVHHADRRDKGIRELRMGFKEPDFPGFRNFIESLSQQDKLPAAWVVVFRSSRGAICSPALRQRSSMLVQRPARVATGVAGKSTCTRVMVET